MKLEETYLKQPPLSLVMAPDIISSYVYGNDEFVATTSPPASVVYVSSVCRQNHSNESNCCKHNDLHQFYDLPAFIIVIRTLKLVSWHVQNCAVLIMKSTTMNIVYSIT